MAGFKYDYKPIDYATAQKQALGQLDPLYQQSLKQLQANQVQQQNQSGQVAAARGLGHSGLAADSLNKIAIATQGNMANLDAQRMTQASQMAMDYVNQDKQYDLQRRGQMYSEYSDSRNYDYQVGRDKVTDNQWNTQFNYNKGRDQVADSQWNKTYNYNKSVDDRNYNYQVSRDKRQDYVTDREWNQMSPAEKQRMAQQYAYSSKLKGSSGGGGGGRRGGHNGKNGSSSSSSKSKSTYKESYIGPSYGDARPTYMSQYVGKEARLNDPERYYESQMARVNEQRKKAGLPPIRVDSKGRGIEY